MAVTAEELLAQLTLAEKCAMVVGDTPWVVLGCERLGIPSWKTSDGPVGVRGAAMGPALLIPGASAIAASWNVDLVEQVGAALGAEAIDRTVDVLLAPTVNLHRSPRAGRHFEMLSEDPELSARIAVAYIRGVQSTNVAACVKHYVANDQEHERTTIDVQVDERTLREVYLRPFEAAVREAGVRTLMASYNYVNGHHATAQPHTLVEILKQEWGFDGVVISDWGATKETVAPACHGLDVEMPAPGEWWGDGQLQAAIERGDVAESVLDDKVRRILALLEWRGRLTGPTVSDEQSRERPEHRLLVRRAATEGMVLLKNDGLLPLASEASIALIGPGAAHTALLGGGSASLTPYRTTNVLDAMRERWSGTVTDAMGIDLRRKAPSIPTEWLPDGVKVSLHAGDEFDSEPIRTDYRPSAFNVWHGSDFPSSGPVSARGTFALVPDVTAGVRLMVAAFGRARLFVDGELIADNEVETFSAGLGLSASTGEIRVEAGRRYDVVLEVRPRLGSAMPLVLFDVGAAVLADVDHEAQVAAAVATAAAADVAVVVVGSNDEWEAEGRDRNNVSLPFGQDQLVRRVIAANSRTVVVLNCGAPVTLPWLDDVPAVLLAWYPGQEGGHAIVDVLVGEAEPGGRMPTTWAREERDTPSFLHYPGEAGVVRYGEGLFVGHRWYDAHGIEPMIPFGHGGSYTRFDWGTPTTSGAGTDVIVEVPVTNVGERAGSDVVQVYVEPGQPLVRRPVRELAGFAKVRLEPGETAVARVRLCDRSFARWDIATSAWAVDPGPYDLVVAASATDERGRAHHVVVH